MDQPKNSPVMTLIGLIAPKLDPPTSGATSYNFPLGEFFDAVSIYGATKKTNGHVFKISIEDKEGNINSDNVLSIIIKEQGQ